MDDLLRNDNARGQAGEVGKTDKFQAALCFDAPPGVNCRLPDPQHLPGRVLARLLQGRRVTHLDAWRERGHSRLADSVWKLRKAGWSVQIHEETVRTSDNGRPAEIGIYYLTDETIVRAGEAGQLYAAECLRRESERRAA